MTAAASSDLDAQFAQALADAAPIPMLLDLTFQALREHQAEVTARLDAIERQITALEQAFREADEGGWPG